MARKNSWQLAGHAGHATPDGLQHLLSRACWNPDGIRDDLQTYVAEPLGRPDGILIIDDTGFLNKATTSAGVQRQYSGTAGCTENCQIGVFAAYAGTAGRALADRELYLPTSWTDDRDRCRAAKVPDQREFATKHPRGDDRPQGAGLAAADRLGHGGRRLWAGQPLPPDAGNIRRRLCPGRPQVPVLPGRSTHRQ
nr:transposase [Streptomyces sp. AC495_CC817]